MGEFEAVGDAVTGGLVGRAVEPGAGEPGADGHTHERNCLNCGTALTGDYCHACGQRAHVHRTLSAFFHDLMHGVLHFEGKIWNTLPMLAWKPGELTRRYIEGERAKFVSPMALFLFSVFLMFAVAGFGGGIATTNTVEVRKGIGEEIAVSEAKLKQLQAQHDDAVRKGVDTKDVDAKIADLQQQAAVLRGLEKGEIATASGVRFDGLPDWFRKPAEQAGKNPELLFYKLKTSAYKYSWLLIPFSVPFLWLMFPFSRRFRIYDHTVFVTYSLSFMTLLVVIGILVGIAGAPALTALLFLIPPVHMYRQLKGAYGLTRGGALLRTFLLIGFAMVAAVLFAVALVGLGIFD